MRKEIVLLFGRSSNKIRRQGVLPWKSQERSPAKGSRASLFFWLKSFLCFSFCLKAFFGVLGRFPDGFDPPLAAAPTCAVLLSTSIGQNKGVVKKNAFHASRSRFVSYDEILRVLAKSRVKEIFLQQKGVCGALLEGDDFNRQCDD